MQKRSFILFYGAFKSICNQEIMLAVPLGAVLIFKEGTKHLVTAARYRIAVIYKAEYIVGVVANITEILLVSLASFLITAPKVK